MRELPETKHRLIDSLHLPGNNLLRKQLANIQAILVSAPNRRDAETKKFGSLVLNRRSSPLPPAKALPTAAGVDCPSASLHMSESEMVVHRASSSDSTELDEMMQELYELSREFKPTYELPSEQEGQKEDLDSLHAELEKMMLPQQDLAPAKLEVSKQLPEPEFVVDAKQKQDNEERKPDLKISIPKEDNHDQGVQRLPEYLGYHKVLQLEQAGIDAETLQDWSAYLLSNAPLEYDTASEHYDFLREADKELDLLIEKTLKEEAEYEKKMEQEYLAHRVIVNNIAADADTEELAMAFYEFEYDIRDIKMVAREPFSRTQSAHIDMYTKSAAMRASRIVKPIYGLRFRSRLATEEDSPKGHSRFLRH